MTDHTKIFLVMAVIICILIYLDNRINIGKKNINILIGNSFRNYHSIPTQPITCAFNNYKYKCQFSNIKNTSYIAAIYNGNRNFPTKPETSYNIAMTIEKLSQVVFMKNIGEGKNKYYQLAVDYRLFKNKWHIPYPYMKNIYYFINSSVLNFKNIESFMKRKNSIVYIQKQHYKNRQYIVNEINKYYKVDSYGNDLNNIKWPKNISRNNKIEVYKTYKFCLAIENSIIGWKRDTKYVAPSINSYYVTEKLEHCLMAGCIPIYFGADNVNLYLPSQNAIINLINFRNLSLLSNYLYKIQNNKTLIKKHINWHSKFSKAWFKRFSDTYNFNYCKVCNHAKKYSKAYFSK